MALSIEKYKGFYIARYELGLESGNPVSKNADTNTNVTTADASQNATKGWYGLYQVQKNMYNTLSSNVKSSMIWGSQYDAVMNWIGVNNATAAVESKRNADQITGKKADDILNNIYDLYGCHYEWTIEATEKSGRVARGGFCWAQRIFAII